MCHVSAGLNSAGVCPQIEGNAEQPLRITRISVAATFDAAAATFAGQQCLQAFLSGSAAPGASPPRLPLATQSPEAKLQAFFQAGASPPSRRALPFPSSPAARPPSHTAPRPAPDARGQQEGPSMPPSAAGVPLHSGDLASTSRQEPPTERLQGAGPVPCAHEQASDGAGGAGGRFYTGAGPRPDGAACVPAIPATECGPGRPCSVQVGHAAPPSPMQQSAPGTSAAVSEPPGSGSQHRSPPAAAHPAPVPVATAQQAAADADPAAARITPANDNGGVQAAALGVAQPAASASASPRQATTTPPLGRQEVGTQATHGGYAAVAAVVRYDDGLPEYGLPPASGSPPTGASPVTEAPRSPDAPAPQVAARLAHHSCHAAAGVAGASAACGDPIASVADPPPQDLAPPPVDTSTPDAGLSSPAPTARAAEAQRDLSVEAGGAGGGVRGGCGADTGGVASAAQGQQAVLEDAVRRARGATLGGGRHDLDRRLALRLQEEELRACKRAKAPAAVSGKAAPAAARGGKGAALRLLSCSRVAAEKSLASSVAAWAVGVCWCGYWCGCLPAGVRIADHPHRVTRVAVISHALCAM